MEKPRMNYWIDLGMAIAFVLYAATGIMKLPALAVMIRGLPFREISTIHDASGVALALFVLLHLLLHFDWLVAMTKSLFEKKK
ncbi:MAG: DUF4405 domain-containing protein [Candidatus Micrarchaeota archaeon]